MEDVDDKPLGIARHLLYVYVGLCHCGVLLVVLMKSKHQTMFTTRHHQPTYGIPSYKGKKVLKNHFQFQHFGIMKRFTFAPELGIPNSLNSFEFFSNKK